MTTAADLLRRFIGRVPETAKMLELLPLHGTPGSHAIASWPIEDARNDAEALRVQILEAGQEHCDAEGEPLLLQITYVKGSTALQARRIRFAPSEESAAMRQGPSDPLVKELLATIRDQQRVMFQGVDTMVKACKQVIEIAGEQTRLLEHRVQQQASIAAEVVDTEEREMRKRAFAIAIERAPELLDLVIHYGASRALGGKAGLNGSGNGMGAPPQQ